MQAPDLQVQSGKTEPAPCGVVAYLPFCEAHCVAVSMFIWLAPEFIGCCRTGPTLHVVAR